MIKNIYLWCKGFYYAERSDRDPYEELQELWLKRVIENDESLLDFLKWRDGYLASKNP